MILREVTILYIITTILVQGYFLSFHTFWSTQSLFLLLLSSLASKSSFFWVRHLIIAPEAMPMISYVACANLQWINNFLPWRWMIMGIYLNIRRVRVGFSSTTIEFNCRRWWWYWCIGLHWFSLWVFSLSIMIFLLFLISFVYFRN